MRRLALAALILAAPAEATEEDKGFLAGLISRALSSRATQVSVGAVEGALSSDATIRDIVLADRDGPWLKIDRARLSWNRLALFKRRLEVERLEIGRISWLRPARKEPAAAPGAPMEWPDLPLKAVVKAFQVQSLDLGAPVLGQPARLGFTGSATLGSPSEGLDLAFAARRLDAPGALDLKLSFTPKTTALNLALDAQEPAGGLLANAAHLPDAPPLTFRFDGAGPLDAFHARLDFAAGPDIGAEGGVDLARDGAGRRLKLALTSRLAGLVPALAAPVFAGQTRLTGDARLGDDGAVTTQAISLESDAAALTVVGGVTAKGEADVTVDAHARPNDQLAKLAFLATVKGALPRPAVALAFDIQGLKSPAGTLAQASAHFTARPETPGDPASALALAGDAAMTGLKLADPALASLVGETGQIALTARATPDGALDVAELKLDGEALHARFAGKAAADALAADLVAEAPDLSRLAGLTGLALKGSAKAQARLSGAHGEYAADVTAEAARLATGIAALDGFAGPSPTLSGGLKTGPAGYAFDKLTLTGAGGAARLDGARPIRAALTIPDARRLDPRVEGEATAQASLTGSDLDLAATLANGRLLGRPARLALAAEARSGATLTARLSGDIDGKPLTGEISATRAEDTVTLPRLAFALGKVRLDGSGKVAAGLLDGRLTLAAPRLEDLSPLALTPLSGAAEADLSFAAESGRQNATIRAKSAEAAFGAARVAGLAVDLKLADLYGDLSADGSASAAKIVAGGETLSGLKLTAKGDRFDLAATARGFALTAKGALRLAAKTLRLDALAATGRGGGLALAEPATLKLAEGGVQTEKLALRLGAGRLSVSGLAGRRLDLTAKAEAVPLALADLVSPGLGLTGTASGDARVQGEAAAPTGDFRLALAAVSAPAARNAGLPALDVKASGRLGQGRASLDATVSAGPAGSLRLAGSAPLNQGDGLDVKASGRLDLAPLTRTLAARGQRLSGTVAVDARLTGALAKPRAEGGATLSGGAFSDDVSGLRLTDLAASLAARGDVVEIARASAQTPGGGTLGASGRIRLEPNFPGEIRLTAENARLIATDIVTAEAGLALEISGPLASAPRVAGRIDVKALDVEIPGRMPGASAPLADVKHIDPGPAAKRRLALTPKQRARGGAAFDAALAISVSAPARVTVHGRGVDAEFGGELKVGGTSARPRIDGGFDLRRGTLTLIGGPLSFARGAIRFEGDALPRLDLEARQTLSDATAIVDVAGPADRPVFAFTSSPELPQDEVLSRLLFQKPSGSLSAFQALQLANTIAALSGGGALDSLRRSLGVDSLDVSTGSGGGPVLGARRAIGDRLSLGVKTGAKPQDNGVTLDLDVTKRLRLSTGVDAKGESSVGAGMQWEY